VGLATLWRASSIALVLSLLVLCGPTSGRAAQEGASQTEKPNVVLILTDDMAASDLRYMPKVRELLVERGTSFENAFVTYSLCCPSRATILCGQYAHNHRVLSNAPPLGAEPRFRSSGADRSTVATWLDAIGYETAHMGKYMNKYGGEYVPPGWDEWQTLAGAHHLNSGVNENGQIVSYGPEVSSWEEHFAPRAAAFVRETQGPFYLQIGTQAPHGPHGYPERYSELYSSAFPPRAPSFNEADVSDKPRWLAQRPRLSPETRAATTVEWRERLRSLRAADDLVGEVVGALEEAGKLDETYLFFTSDNGYHLGEHRLIGKWTPYEETIGVPLVARGPGILAGATKRALVLNNDLAPTFTDLAGATTPSFVDGRSLKPLLTGPPSERWRERFLVESWQDPKRPSSPPTYKAVRTPRHLYVRYATGERELYDLREDPHQLRSRHETAGRKLLSALKLRLEALKDCEARACRTAEGG